MKDKRRIGILTLSASDNCGSLLQTYALKNVIQSMNVGEVEVINFTTDKSHAIYDIFSPYVRKNRKRVMKRVKKIRGLLREKHDYRKFRRRYIGMSLGREIFPDDLEQAASKYDVVVVGSDQVWNVRMCDYDVSFFAPQVRCTKVAYGPSLGGYDIREDKNWEQLVEYLHQFSAISVREGKGKNCLEELLQKEIDIVLDPTLLLSAEEWEKLVGERIVKEEYIFYYSWAYNDNDINEIVRREGARLQCPVYVINASKWIDRDYRKWGFILSDAGGPQAFLNLMYYSNKNFVQSLHGTIFAYIFKTDFWLLDEYENYEDLDTRLRYLLEQLGMKNRLLTKYNYATLNMDEKPYYKSNQLADLKKKSYQYLQESLHN